MAFQLESPSLSLSDLIWKPGKKHCNWLTSKKNKTDWNSGITPYGYLHIVIDLIRNIREYEVIDYSDSLWVLFTSNLNDFRNRTALNFFYQKQVRDPYERNGDMFIT